MYIKQVIIEGFKSYREQVATEPFNPKVNCVVGANGSGKTNFFHAIRFVLGDLFQNLCSEEDRHALLHEGATGHQVLSAFVEIVFDNSDNRIPVDKEEVCLRRTVGLEKDQFFLDGKHITKTEVMNLLESAGLSRSNPYYVVQQGKLASLTLMKDAERLDLLKEIGGTRVYEESRRASLKIMQETGNKRKQIIQRAQYLNERLRELDEEEELRKYQQLDKQRRSLEYTIYDKEHHDARQKLWEVDEARTKASETKTKLEKESRDLNKSIQVLSKEKEIIEKRRIEAMMKHAQVELDGKDLKEKFSGNIREKDEACGDLEFLAEKIQESRDELETIRSSYNHQLSNEEEINKGIMDREKQLSILYQKQGCATQFSNKAAQDKWLQKENDDLHRILSSNLEQEKKLQDEIQDLNTGLQNQDTYIEERKTEFKRLESHIKEYLKRHRDELQDRRKYLWKKESAVSAEIDEHKRDVAKAQKSLDLATPCDIKRGLDSVQKLVKDHQMPGVYGPIIELFCCEEKFFTCVEITAGNSLFHVVVDTDETSSRLSRYLNSLKGGLVTFIPLNRVSPPHVTYPHSSDVVPLLKKLKFATPHAAVFQQLFGRTVICMDSDVATKAALSQGLDCITLEGDIVRKEGSMTMGLYDYKHSKLKFVDVIRRNTWAIVEKERELKRLRTDLQEIDTEITKLVTEQQKVDAKQAHDKSELEKLRQDIANATEQKQSISKALEKKEKLLANARYQIKQFNSTMRAKWEEVGMDLIDHLSAEEKDLLTRLNLEITQLKEMLIDCKTSRIKTETRKGELETNLSTNLVRRQQELEARKSSAGTILHGEADQMQELRDVKEFVDDTTQQLERVCVKVDEFTIQMIGIKDKKSRLKALQDECQRTLQDEEKELDHLLSKRNILLAKQEFCVKKIMDLGSLPSDTFNMYKRNSIKQLHEMLHKCKEQLQQFSHVNKKTLDQYINFMEQREELQKRQAELDAGDEQSRELISVLDQKKDESIERTFKAVARHFQEVFSELVPGGHGFLVMVKKKDVDHGDDNEPHGVDPEGRVEKYIGVKVKVSFTGQGETQSMKQLSEGQKTVVALTLIFAIQRCDPAPFYLFDEIDAALEPQYRIAVRNMIRCLADMANTQFITTTTFWPELVKVADKIYGVTHKNRVSCVNVISKDRALDFIKHDQSHNI